LRKRKKDKNADHKKKEDFRGFGEGKQRGRTPQIENKRRSRQEKTLQKRPTKRKKMGSKGRPRFQTKKAEQRLLGSRNNNVERGNLRIDKPREWSWGRRRLEPFKTEARAADQKGDGTDSKEWGERLRTFFSPGGVARNKKKLPVGGRHFAGSSKLDLGVQSIAKGNSRQEIRRSNGGTP